jgi:hypothetical protein
VTARPCPTCQTAGPCQQHDAPVPVTLTEAGRAYATACQEYDQAVARRDAAAAELDDAQAAYNRAMTDLDNAGADLAKAARGSL